MPSEGTVRHGFRAKHNYASRPGRKSAGNFYSEKLPSWGRGKPLCGLSVTAPSAFCVPVPLAAPDFASRDMSEINSNY